MTARDWGRFFVEKDLHKFTVRLNTRGEAWDGCNGKEELIGHLNAILREAVEAAPRVYGEAEENGPLLKGEIWEWYDQPSTDDSDTHAARLIDVKPVEKSK